MTLMALAFWLIHQTLLEGHGFEQFRIKFGEARGVATCVHHLFGLYLHFGSP